MSYLPSNSLPHESRPRTHIHFHSFAPLRYSSPSVPLERYAFTLLVLLCQRAAQRYALLRPEFAIPPRHSNRILICRGRSNVGPSPPQSLPGSPGCTTHPVPGFLCTPVAGIATKRRSLCGNYTESYIKSTVNRDIPPSVAGGALRSENCQRDLLTCSTQRASTALSGDSTSMNSMPIPIRGFMIRTTASACTF